MRTFYLICSLLFISNIIYSQHDIYSIADGNWNDPATWNLNRIPNATDTVLVNDDVDVTDGPHTVQHLFINNGQGHRGGVYFTNSELFKVLGNVKITHFSAVGDAYLSSLDGKIQIDGNLHFEREPGNVVLWTGGLKLQGNTELTVNGDFIYDYNGVGILEIKTEILLADSSIMTVFGTTNWNVLTGQGFDAYLDDESQLNTKGDMELSLEIADYASIEIDTAALMICEKSFLFENNSQNHKKIYFDVNGELDVSENLKVKVTPDCDILFNVLNDYGRVEVGGNLDIFAVSDNDFKISMTGRSEFALGGNVIRNLGYGDLDMEVESKWIYNGTGPQDIVCSAGTGEDSLQFTNVIFNNTSGEELELIGDLIVKEELMLMTGIVKSTDSTLVIVEDGAVITGGSKTAFIEGPIKKINLTGTTPFTFPLGSEGVYGPMTIVSKGGRAAGGEYKARYMNCPPPWGGALASNLDQISSQDHWELVQSPDASPVNVMLHWTDAEAQGIMNLDSLVVAMYNPDSTEYPMFEQGWTSIGNGGTTGGTGNGVSGSVMNIGTCPPPWGISAFAIGSTSNDNALPLEMETLFASLNGEVIDINWSVGNIQDVAKFYVEKSTNGTNFNSIGKVEVKDLNSSYACADIYPTPGVNYYRIKQVDLDGMIAFSSIVSINFNETSDITIFPNPIEDQFILTGKTLKRAESIRIFDDSGQMVYFQNIDRGLERIGFEPSMLNMNKTGIYYLELNNGSKPEVIKLFKL